MKYTMKVKIVNPKQTKPVVGTLWFELECNFIYDEEQYGKKMYLSIIGDSEFFDNMYFDLRYDTSFNRNNKIEWLENWAKGFWSGKNGAWRIKKLDITKHCIG